MSRLIIRVALESDPTRFARFTWSADLSDCDCIAVGLTDDQLGFIVAHDGHEGINIDGYAVSCE